MTVGDAQGAVRAYDGMLPLLEMGSARRVYRDADVVYKVELERGANLDEARALTWLATQELPKGIRLPNWSGYLVEGPYLPSLVLAMEYIEGQLTGLCTCNDEDSTCPCATEPAMPEDLRGYFFHTLEHRDVGLELGNIIARDGFYYLVDLDISLGFIPGVEDGGAARGGRLLRS